MSVPKFLARIISAIAVASGAATGAGLYPAPRDIAMALPEYCWSQYFESYQDHSDPRYRLTGCGSQMNHYCPGLVDIAMASRARDRDQKRRLLRSAKDNMEYSLRGMKKDGPTCFLRQEAEAHLRTIEFRLKLLK